jgi:hypothetical protein
MICAPSDEKNLAAIESLIATQIPRADNPLKDAPAPEVREEEPRRTRDRGERRRREEPRETAEASVPQVREPRDRSDDRGGRDRGRDRDRRGPRERDETVIGMGDHLPTFIEKSFEERMGS